MKCSKEGCQAQATHQLVQPDGIPNAGGWVCLKHGREIVKEYREKLQEKWTILRVQKYGNQWTSMLGRRFQSKAEAERYQELFLLERAGKISGLDCQPRYEILPAFVHQGEKVRKIEYVADFRYRDIATGKIIVEDVKGVKTAAYLIKVKMFKQKNPGIVFREITVRGGKR